jgi:hypothetical protein
MPKLVTSAPSTPAAAGSAATGAVPSTEPSLGHGSDVGSTLPLLSRLQSLHRRLLMLRAARQHAADGLDEQQVRKGKGRGRARYTTVRRGIIAMLSLYADGLGTNSGKVSAFAIYIRDADSGCRRVH